MCNTLGVIDEFNSSVYVGARENFGYLLILIIFNYYLGVLR